MAHALPTWREPEAILALAELGVAEREGVRRARHHRAPGRARRRRARPLLRHAPHRHLLLADPPPRRRGPPDPLPRARRASRDYIAARRACTAGGDGMTRAEDRELAAG